MSSKRWGHLTLPFDFRLWLVAGPAQAQSPSMKAGLWVAIPMHLSAQPFQNQRVRLLPWLQAEALGPCPERPFHIRLPTKA